MTKKKHQAESVEFSLGSNIASLLRSGQLLAVPRDDGQVGYILAEKATPEQRQKALDAEIVIRTQGLSGTNSN